MKKTSNQLNPNKILNKEFKTGIRGYNQEEVDEFLDIIIQDYQMFENKINNLKREVSQLKRRLDSESTGPSTSQRTQQVNYDILQRLSNLEKEVFGNKYARS